MRPFEVIMKALLINGVGLSESWYFCDTSSSSVVAGIDFGGGDDCGGGGCD